MSTSYNNNLFINQYVGGSNPSGILYVDDGRLLKSGSSITINSNGFLLADGSGLYNLNASNVSTGTLNINRLGSSGSRTSSTFLRGDNAWATPTASQVGAYTTSQVDTFLANKANLTHTHAWADVSGTPTTLAGYGITNGQPLDATLTALAALNSTAGLLEQTGSDTFTKRSIGVASATDILTRADGDSRYSASGHAHDFASITSKPTTLAGYGITNGQLLDGTLTSLSVLDSTPGLLEQTAIDAFTKRAIGVATSVSILTRADGDARFAASGHSHPFSSLTSIPTTLSGHGITDAQPLDATLTALAGLNSTAGILEQTGADTFTKRSIGVTNATDLLTRADGDNRFSASGHTHTFASLTSKPTTLSGYGISDAQSLDSTLTALAALDGTAGLLEQTGVDTFTRRSMGTGASTSVLTRADGDGRYATSSHTHDASGIVSGTIAVARLPIFSGATSTASGVAGLVPAPASGDYQKYFKADGTWATVAAGATAAGSDTQVQFKDGSTDLGADAGFVYNKTNDTVSIIGSADSQRLILKAHSSQNTPLLDVQNSSGVTIRAITGGGGLIESLTVTTASGNITLVSTSTTYQLINPNSANRDVNLPSSPPTGLTFTIKNTATTGTNVLVVKDSGGTQVGQSIPIKMSMCVIYSGSAWEVL